MKTFLFGVSLTLLGMLTATEAFAVVTVSPPTTSDALVTADLFDVLDAAEDIDDLLDGDFDDIDAVDDIEDILDDVEDSIDDTSNDIEDWADDVDDTYDEISDDIEDWFD